MPFFEDRSTWRSIGILLAVLAILFAGSWATIKFTTDYLLDTDAGDAAQHWANFIATNVTDLEQVANGEQPSTNSLSFFKATQNAGPVYRYVIYNRDGYSQLVTEQNRIAPVDLSEFNAAAARAGRLGIRVTEVKTGTGSQPSHFVEAYVPVLVKGRTVAVVGAFVDETAQRDQFFWAFILGASALILLIGAAFSVPAVAWYFRTKEKQRVERRLQFLAHHDVLTGLANRARLIERLEGVLASLSSSGGLAAVHFIDIDHFKEVNDMLGHDGGDFLLNTFGKRLRSLTRIEDLVSRLGGDEFVVIQAAVATKNEVESFAERIASILSEPVTYREQEIDPHVTIGVAVAPTDGNSPERLLKSADLALYSGKIGGRNCIRFFSSEMDEAMRARLRLEKLIRDAVTHASLVLHYQPIYENKGRHLIGFEALMRLPAPDGTLIAPANFIPLAEEMRLIDKIGEWVLHEACRTAQTWPSDLTVAVNLSEAQFESGELTGIVSTALKESGLDPHRLELEITEKLLIANDERTMTQLRQFKEMGISVVMDNFGTGYSSLRYLWQFPFDKIKIDRSFMQSFNKSGNDVETVVKTIIALGRQLNMRVTVEGVETPEQVNFLYDAEADQVQGFFFGRPVPASEISAQLLGASPQSSTSAKPHPSG